LGKAWAAGVKSLLDYQQSVKYKSTTIKTSWSECTATSSKDRQIGTYSMGPTILGNIGCLNKKKTMRLTLGLPYQEWVINIYRYHFAVKAHFSSIVDHRTFCGTMCYNYNTIVKVHFKLQYTIHYDRNLQIQLCYGKATLSYADRGIGSIYYILHVYSTAHCYYDRKMFIVQTTWCTFTNVLKKDVFWTIFVTKHF
jgi:hypothetical protein